MLTIGQVVRGSRSDENAPWPSTSITWEGYASKSGTHLRIGCCVAVGCCTSLQACKIGVPEDEIDVRPLRAVALVQGEGFMMEVIKSA